MTILKSLESRSNNTCELCSNKDNLSVYTVEPTQNDDANDHILLCDSCVDQIKNPDKIDVKHWRCLNESMWSEIPAVQVMAWRMLQRLKKEAWAQDLLNMIYLNKETLSWAKATGEGEILESIEVHKDCNGVTLENGDSVVLIKDLKVKGTSFVAKRGAAVRRISLVHDNHEHIEGKVEGQQIVILTKYVKKT